jgi:hypothetical protein
MSTTAPYIKAVFITLFHLFGAMSSFAQPGDGAVTFDGSGYHNNFKVYSCTIGHLQICNL